MPLGCRMLCALQGRPAAATAVPFLIMTTDYRLTLYPAPPPAASSVREFVADFGKAKVRDVVMTEASLPLEKWVHVGAEVRQAHTMRRPRYPGASLLLTALYPQAQGTDWRMLCLEPKLDRAGSLALQSSPWPPPAFQIRCGGQ